MLVLSRKTGQSFYIGDDITVEVIGVVGNQVRLGFKAPRSVSIDRAEIAEKKKKGYEEPNGNR